MGHYHYNNSTELYFMSLSMFEHETTSSMLLIFSVGIFKNLYLFIELQNETGRTYLIQNDNGCICINDSCNNQTSRTMVFTT